MMYAALHSLSGGSNVIIIISAVSCSIIIVKGLYSCKIRHAQV